MPGYNSPPGDGLDQLIELIRECVRRLNELERPSGSQVAESLKKINDILAGLLNPSSITTTGSITAGTTMAASGNISTSGYFLTPAGYGFDITYTRRGAWLGNDGLLGWASSSATKKAKIRDANIDPLAVLSIAPRLFNYRAEVQKKKDDPDYHVATEFGAIAEELHELGLWQVVMYEWDVRQALEPVLDGEGLPVVDPVSGEPVTVLVGQPERIGEPRPVGIHYELLGLLAIEAAKHLQQRLDGLESRLDAAGF